MSNHDGGYRLNEVFRRLHKMGFVKKFGQRKAQQFVLEMTERARRYYDFNSGEIMDELGRAYGLCGYCLEPAPKVIKNWCLKCRAELLEPEELTPAERKARKEAAAAKAATP
jgi:hypothetical protein